MRAGALASTQLAPTRDNVKPGLETKVGRLFGSCDIGRNNAYEQPAWGLLMSEVKEKIREFVVDHFLFGEDNGLADDSSLLELGVVDSTGVLELVTHVETTFGIKVADDELVPDNLDTIQNLTDFVCRKTSRLEPSPPVS